LEKYQVKVFAASVDDQETNRRFAEQNHYPFPILSDPEKKVAKAYGVLAPAGYAQRVTFIIDATGTIRKVDSKVSVQTHGKDLAAALEAIGVPKK
jgi:peroxiredoxin Q/BCP